MVLFRQLFYRVLSEINPLSGQRSTIYHNLCKPKVLFLTGAITLISISSPIISRMAHCSTVEKSSDITLYSHHHSFYAQKVLLALYEKKIDFKTVTIDITSGENYGQSFLKINPRGEVPVIKVGDEIIPDSARIIDYLEEHFTNDAHPSLIPSDPQLLQTMKTLREKIDVMPANKITFAACNHEELIRNAQYPFSLSFARQGLRDTFKTTIPTIKKAAETTDDPTIREILLKKVANQEMEKETIASMDVFTQLMQEAESLLDYIEQHLSTLDPNVTWLVSDQFTIADVGLAIYLDRLHRVGISHSLWNKDTRPLINKYYDRITARKTFQCAVPHVTDDIKQFFRKFLPF